MSSAITTAFFQSPSLLYVPFLVVFSFVLLLIPALLAGGKAEASCRVIGCYMLKTVGVILVGMSGLELTYGLVSMRFPVAPALPALILIMAVGLGLLIHASRVVSTIKDPSSVLLHAIFCRSCEVVGSIIVIVAGLSLMIGVIVNNGMEKWEMPATLLLLGLILAMSSALHVSDTKPTKKKRR